MDSFSISHFQWIKTPTLTIVVGVKVVDEEVERLLVHDLRQPSTAGLVALVIRIPTTHRAGHPVISL